MNRIDQKFESLKNQQKKALSVFLTAGYPSLVLTEQLIGNLEKLGVDFFEIGLPFSDPIADGAIIQKSSEVALKNGVTWEKVLELVKRVRVKSQVPLLLMGYANSFYCRGWKKSIQECAEAGVDGVIIPDLVPDHQPELSAGFASKGIHLIYLVAPTSPLSRIKKIVAASKGFVYCVSVTGVTGARKSYDYFHVENFINKVRSCSKVPVVLGFGISEPEQCVRLKKSVDGFVIGSRMIRAIGESSEPAKIIQAAQKLIQPFIQVM